MLLSILPYAGIAEAEPESVFCLDRNYLFLNSTEDSYFLRLVNTTGDEELVWSSSDENVATVTADGVVVPVAAGKTIITVQNQVGNSDECVVSIRETLTQGIRITTPYIIGEQYQTFRLGIEAAEGVDISNPVWSCDDSNLCNVTSTGLVTILAHSHHKATITVTADGYTDTCDVYITGTRSSNQDSVSSNVHFMTNKNDEEQLLQYMYYNPSNNTFTHYVEKDNDGTAWIDYGKGRITSTQMIGDYTGYQAAVAYRAPYTGTLRVFYNNGAHTNSVAGIRIMHGMTQVYPTNGECIYTDQGEIITVGTRLIFPTITLSDPTQYATQWATGVPINVKAGDYVYVLSVYANGKENRGNGLISYSRAFEFKYDEYEDEQYVNVEKKHVYAFTGDSFSANAVVKTGNLTYSSSDSSVASVDADGNITANKKGACRIYVMADGAASYIDVTVVDNFRISGITKNADGTINITVEAKPFGSDKATVIAAVYNRNNDVDKAYFAGGTNISTTENTTLEINNILIDDTQYLKVFAWNDLQDLVPIVSGTLVSPKQINEAG